MEKVIEVDSKDRKYKKQTKNIPSASDGKRLWDFGIGKKSFRTATGNTNGREKWILRLFLWTLFCLTT